MTNIPDRRDERGRNTPDRWQPQGAPRTQNQHPAGGMISTDQYRHKGPEPMGGPTNAPTPFPAGDRRGIKTER